MALKISNIVHSLVYNLSRNFLCFWVKESIIFLYSWKLNCLGIISSKGPFITFSQCLCLSVHIYSTYFCDSYYICLFAYTTSYLSPNIKGHKGWHFLQGFMIFVLTFKCVAQFKLNFVNSWIKNFGSLFCMWTLSCPGTEISFFY